MDYRPLVLGGALALSIALPAQAQTVDGSQVDEILNIARGYGSATLEAQTNGDPKISGKIDGVTYQVFFMNCTDNKNCEDLNFYAGFLDNKQTLEAINAWNRDKRFGKAYLDSDLDAEQNQPLLKTKLRMPVLAVGARHFFGDEVQGQMELVAEKVSGVILDWGHNLPLEAPDQLAAAYLAFFRSGN